MMRQRQTAPHSMPVTITVRGERLSEIQFSTRDLMREIGLLARERIIRRTLSGQDAQDAAFAPYSLGYAKAKQQALGSSDPVNLQVSGDMLNNIAITEVTDHSVTLGFTR